MSEDLTTLAYEVRIACQRVSRRVRYDTATSSLPPHVLSVLFALRTGAKTPGELADAERVSAPSMSKTVSVLVDRGLAERSPDPDDGRRCLLEITKEGSAALAEVASERDSFMVQRLASLSKADREILRRASAILTEVVSK